MINMNKLVYRLYKKFSLFLPTLLAATATADECNFLKLAEITVRNCELNQEGMQFKCRYNAAANCVIVSNTFGAFS